MIEQQIRTWEVLDPEVLNLLHQVPREKFVPTEYQGVAFADTEIPLYDDVCMLSPKLEARLIQSLSLQKKTMSWWWVLEVVISQRSRQV
jgi:protein-L-isoaspartate(D-aspartate) O-methyltransferase